MFKYGVGEGLTLCKFDLFDIMCAYLKFISLNCLYMAILEFIIEIYVPTCMFSKIYKK